MTEANVEIPADSVSHGEADSKAAIGGHIYERGRRKHLHAKEDTVPTAEAPGQL